MVRRACDGAGLLAAFAAGVANLEAHVDEVNSLNVYPVPDGDTGSNMVATVKAALAEAELVGSTATAERVAAAISFGALMGARGNSGVITSQILRGLAEGLVTKTRFSGPDLAHSLAKGSEAAYRAVGRPVEGTILTVIREAAAAAVVRADADGDLEAVLTATVEAAEKAVARTPNLLSILREAGVVDAGGQGLYRLLQGALRHLVEGTAVATTPVAGRATPRRAALVAHADEGFGYETMYLLEARPGSSLDVDAIRLYLEAIGNSVLVAGDARAVKVHVHNERPDLVLGHALGLGSLSRISVENLDSQVHDVREARAGEFTRSPLDPAIEPAGNGAPGNGAVGNGRAGNGAAPPSEPVSNASPNPGPVLETPPSDLDGHLAVVAVVAGDGLEAVFRDFGVSGIVKGGQTTNPSTGELLAAIRSADAREILLLPNNPNVILAARQVARMAGRPVEIVPTRNAAEGLAALLALDPTRDAAGNVDQMTDAARAVQTVSITEAVRDSSISGRKVKRGQAIALGPDDGLVAVDADPVRAACTAVAALRPGFELLTVYYGNGSTLDEAEALARTLGTMQPGVDVEVVHGGQPHYRYLIAAE